MALSGTCECVLGLGQKSLCTNVYAPFCFSHRRMISAFGSGAAFSLVSGMASGNKLQGAFTTGTLFALFQGAFFVVSSMPTTIKYTSAMFMNMPTVICIELCTSHVK